MKQRSLINFLAATLLWVSARNVSANGFRLASQDAFATARGEAFVATADNASAIYYNPAGIARLEGNNLRAGIYGIYLDPTYREPNSGNTYHIANRDKLAAVPQLFYTYTPKECPVSLGLGIYSPYGLSAAWPEDTGFRAVALNGSLTYIRFNPVAALKLPYHFSIAAGLMVDYAKMDLEQGMI